MLPLSTSPAKLSVVYLSVFIVVALYIWLTRPDEGHGLLRLLHHLGQLGVVLVAVNFYSKLRSREREYQRSRSRDTLLAVTELWEKLERDFDATYPYSVALWNETHPEAVPLPCPWNASLDAAFSARRKWAEKRVTRAIFQACENYLTLGIFDSTQEACWLRVFLQLFRSQTLQRSWLEERQNFSDDAAAFVDSLVSAAEGLGLLRGALSRNDYEEAAASIRIPLRHET